mmetsp:Transcript_18728/g.44463  ORF Transcript_18728/g.44463 Transcript_18728/m.44463 type:complete len:83 (-) Transcript_18728:37-285(-)
MPLGGLLHIGGLQGQDWRNRGSRVGSRNPKILLQVGNSPLQFADLARSRRKLCPSGSNRIEHSDTRSVDFSIELFQGPCQGQ